MTPWTMLQPFSDPNASNAEEVDIWRIDLNCDSTKVNSSIRNLSSDEKEKAGRFRFEKDRDRYIVARANLRDIIGSYTDLKPDEIRFSYNKYGKPFLDNGNPELRFNLSHSRDIALIAVTSGRDVGIDIEFIDNGLDILTTARGIFSTTELSILEKLPSDLRTPAFFRGWTRKEAYLKALGKGFSDESINFPVSLLTDEHTISFSTNNGGQDRNWSLMTLATDFGYSAAVAVEGEIGTLRNGLFVENELVKIGKL